MRKLLTYLISLLAALPLAAQRTDEATARRRAEAFLTAQRANAQQRGMKAKHVGTLALAEQTEATYLFADESGTFVLTAADERLPAILGYGTRGQEMPAALRALIGSYQRALALGGLTPMPAYDGPEVAPILTMTRHQEAPYNDLCPFYMYEDSTLSATRCVVGCVATALEEIITSYRRPVVLLDTLFGWSTEHYTIADALPGTSVDTRLILDNYNDPARYTAEQAEAVARLSLLCGMAAKMQYGVDESGANIETLVEPLQRAFGWGYVRYADSYKYTPTDWIALLRQEIQQGRPVLIAGYAMLMNGHAFVLDGLDAEGYFHANWGVDGTYDGYFRLDCLYSFEPRGFETDAGAVDGYFANQQALLLHPDAITPTLPDTLARTGTEVVVDSITLAYAPSQWRYIPTTLHVRNAATYATSTPLLVFTAGVVADSLKAVLTPAEIDSIMLSEGIGIGLTQVQLEPGEARAVTLMSTFPAVGDFMIGVTPDDRHVLNAAPVTVNLEAYNELTFSAPSLAFPEMGKVVVTQHIANAPNAGRAGDKVLYQLYIFPDDVTADSLSADEAAARAAITLPAEGHTEAEASESNGETYTLVGHTDYCLLPAGAEETDTITFAGIAPGTRCMLRVRYPWTLRSEVSFRMPTIVSGIGQIAAEQTAETPYAADVWHDLQGRRIARPTAPGVYVRGGRKIIISSSNTF